MINDLLIINSRRSVVFRQDAASEGLSSANYELVTPPPPFPQTKETPKARKSLLFFSFLQGERPAVPNGAWSRDLVRHVRKGHPTALASAGAEPL